MASFNQVILLGNVTREIEQRFMPNNNAVADFGLCCNRRYKGSDGQQQEEAMFVDVVAFGKQAETLAKFVGKGDLLFVTGRLKLDTREDKQGGGKRSKHRVVVENFQLMPNKREPDQRQSPPAANQDEPAF